MPRKSKFTPEEQIDMVKMYQSGLSIVKIAEIFKSKAPTIASLLKKHIGNLRSNKENSRVYQYDEDYFTEIDTAQKAYWLGFIYADGYVKRNGSSKMFGITLSIEDKDHLEKFKKAINYNYPIKIYKPTVGSYSEKQYCRVLVFGEEIYDNLIKHGVLENKTFKLKAPNIKKAFIKHFIRGYIDGDGSITYNSADQRTFRVKIVGTIEMLNFIKTYIEENNVAIIHKYYQRRKDDKVYSIELGGNFQVKNFLDLIYKNANVYLERKYTRYKELCHMLHSRL